MKPKSPSPRREREPDARPPEPDPYPPSGYAWYVVGVLTLAYVFSFIDRQILSLMVGPIQNDLGINDKQMGLLIGFSFAVFYTLFGIPLGRLADTRSRRVIISVGIAVWSVMTAGCGLARTFWQLAVMRMGVGVGEASLSPSAYSLISDYFRPERRSTAMTAATGNSAASAPRTDPDPPWPSHPQTTVKPPGPPPSHHRRPRPPHKHQSQSTPALAVRFWPVAAGRKQTNNVIEH